MSVASAGSPTLSNHLQILRLAGLVSTRKEGTKVYYQLSGAEVAALWAHLRDVASTHLAEVDRARAAYLGDDIAEVTRDELLRRPRRRAAGSGEVDAGGVPQPARRGGRTGNPNRRRRVTRPSPRSAWGQSWGQVESIRVGGVVSRG
jgi:DNA-binding transcriptional ArsR family regulator